MRVYSQAVGRIHSQACDWLRRLSTDPHQLDHQVYLVTGGLLQRGTAHSAGGDRRTQTLLRKSRSTDEKMTSCGAAAAARQLLVDGAA